MTEHVLDHSKAPTFMDATPANYFDTLSGIDTFLQYPHSPYGVSDMSLPQTSSPRLGYNALSLSSNGMGEYTYGPSAASFGTPSPGRPYTPPGSSIYPGVLSAGELSSDSVASSRSRRGSGAVSPPPVPASSLAAVPRSHRFNPLAGMPTRTSARQAKKRGSKGSDDFDSDNDDDFNPASTAGMSNDMRREEIRRQRIESEQRRRDELRDGYRRLKDALPVSNQKSSKVSLLDRATTHIRYLEMTQQQLQTRLQQAESETARLRHVNEALMLGTAEQRHAAAASAAAAAVTGAPAPPF